MESTTADGADGRAGEHADGNADGRRDATAGDAALDATPHALAAASLDAERLSGAFEFVARLHLFAKAEDAPAQALDRLARLLPADLWALRHVRGLGGEAEPRSAEIARRPSRPAGTETDPTDADEAAEECVLAAYRTGNQIRRQVAAASGRLDVLALPLVAGTTPAPVLVGVRRAASENGDAPPPWAADDFALLASLAAPFGAWLDARRQSAEAERLLLTDDLTGLRNARYLRETLVTEIKRARRYGSRLAVLFIDLDDFKTVNDEHGHLVGSHALVEAGATITSGVRATDTVARYGGDEFVVVLPDTPLEAAAQVAERIRLALAERRFTGGRRLSLALTASFGVAAFPEHAQSPQQLIAAADAAMYAAKERRKNCVSCAADDRPRRYAG